MPAPYRRASRHGFLWVCIVLSGLACSVALSLMLQKRMSWGVMLTIFFVPFLGSVAIGLAVLSRIRRRRIGGIQAMLERDGFVMDIKPDEARKAAVFAPVADLERRAELRYGATGIQWVALHTRQSSSQCIFEHIHFTGSGKSTQEHRHTIIAWLTQQPAGTRDVSAFRTRWLKRRALKESGGIIATGDARFDRAWVTVGEAAAARAFFTDSVRLLLADSPKGESWHVGSGSGGGPNWIVCIYDGAFDARNLALFRRRCEQIVAAPGVR